MRFPSIFTLNWQLLFFLGLILRQAGAAFSVDELRHGFYDVDIINEPILHPLQIDETKTGDESGEKESEKTARSPNEKEAVENPDDFVVISNLGGQEYYCSIPKFIPPPKIEELLKRQRSWTTENVTLRLEPLRKRRSCLHKTIGWWTYEFCYGTDIRQYHMENGKIVGDEIYLGHFDVDYDWAQASDAERGTRRLKSAFFHSQNYTRGSLCELKNRMRTAEVRYFCELDADGSYISRVDEPESCQYLITIQTSLICDLPGFLSESPEHRPPAEIQCRPALAKPDFHAYQAEMEQRKEQQKQKIEAKEKLQKQKEIERQLKPRKTIENQQQNKKLIENYLAEFQNLLETKVKTEFSKYGIDLDSMHIMTVNVGANGGTDDWDENGPEDETFVGSEKDRFFDLLDEIQFEAEQKKQKNFDFQDEIQFEADQKRKNSNLQDEIHFEADQKRKNSNLQDEIQLESKQKQKNSDFQDKIQLESKQKNQMKIEIENVKDKIRQNFDDDPIFDEFENELKKAAAEGKKIDAMKIKEKMEKNFDSILSEAEKELQNDQEKNGEIPIEKTDKNLAFKTLSETLNQLLERIDNLEKDVEETNQKLKRKKNFQLPWDKPKFEEKNEEKIGDRLKDDTKEFKSQEDLQLSDKMRRRLSTETQNIEEKLISELKKTGFDTKNGNVQVKIIKTGRKGKIDGVEENEANEENFDLLSETETADLTNLIVSMLKLGGGGAGGAGSENPRQKEANKQRKIESNYKFRWKSKEKKQTAKN